MFKEWESFRHILKKLCPQFGQVLFKNFVQQNMIPNKTSLDDISSVAKGKVNAL